MDSALYIGVILSFVVGLIFAVSKIVPGISASTLLLALGLFYWMNSTVLHFDLLYLVPFGLGFIVAVALFSKVMWHLIENHHHPLYYFIVGLTLGSIIVILATDEVTESWDALGMNAAFIAVAAAAIGLVVSLAFGRINSQDDTGKAV
jgi:putative membrane protein